MASREAVRMLEGIYTTVDKMIRERLPQAAGTGAAATTRIVDVTLFLGAAGTSLTTSDHVFIYLSLGGDAEILSWSMGASTGVTPTTCEVFTDVKIGGTLSTLTIIGSPELDGVIEMVDQPMTAPTAWTVTTIPDPSWVWWKPYSIPDPPHQVNLTLRCQVG